MNIKHFQLTSVNDTQSSVVGKCRSCKKVYTIECVPTHGLIRWLDGALIQNVLPWVSSNDREFLISGMCPQCFDEVCRV